MSCELYISVVNPEDTITEKKVHKVNTNIFTQCHTGKKYKAQYMMIPDRITTEIY